MRHFNTDETAAKKKVSNDTNIQGRKTAGVMLLAGLMLMLLGLLIAFGKGNSTVVLISLLPIVVGFVIWNNSKND